MELNLNRKIKRTEQKQQVKSFIDELQKALESTNNKERRRIDMSEIKLNNEQEIEFERKKFFFLEDYFKKELEDLSKGEIFIVTNKYENDPEYHRYKVAQYKENKERKYIAFEKDLPKGIKLEDVVRKINGKYIYDKEATEYIKENIEKIKEEIIKKVE